MKTKLTLGLVSMLSIILLGISGCSSTGSAVKCPDLSSRKGHIPSFAKLTKSNHHSKTDNTVTASTTPATANPEQQKVTAKTMKPNLLAAAFKDDVPFQVKIPRLMDKQITEAQTDEINNMLGQYSNNKVALARNEKGRLVLKADSRKDFTKLIKSLESLKSAAPIDGHVADILALVGGILGIVALGLSVIPFVDFVSLFPTGPGGIVLGALSLKNTDSRRKWSILGIALGAAGITLAIVFIILYSVVLGLFWI